MTTVIGLMILAAMWITEAVHRRFRERFLAAMDRRIEDTKALDAREQERHRVLVETVTAFERSRALPARRATGAPS